MSYRIGEPKPPKPRRTMENLTSPSDIYLTLGTSTLLAVPCWYIEVHKPIPAVHHSRDYHDFKGAPSPNHRDHVCQAWDFAHSCCSIHHDMHHCDHCDHFIDMKRVSPIHMLEEGYEDVEVITEFMEGDSRVSLSGSASIDREDDWILRVRLSSVASEASNRKPYEPALFRLSVFVSGNIHGIEKRDLALQSKVQVLPTAVR